MGQDIQVEGAGKVGPGLWQSTSTPVTQMGCNWITASMFNSASSKDRQHKRKGYPI